MKPHAPGKVSHPPALPVLTSFRFFAAMAIVCFHSIAQSHEYLRSGVSFFYVLSGFILTYVHPHLESWLLRTQFWIGRLARIWPLHLVTLALAICLFPSPHIHHLPQLVLFLNTVLLQAWVPIGRVLFSYNGVSWSLSVELFFYFIFPFILPFVTKAPGRAVILTLIFTLFLGSGASLLGMPDETEGSAASYDTFVIFNPMMNLYKFVLGMAVAVWWMSTPPMSRRLPWGWIEGLTFFGVMGFVPLSESLAGVLTDWQMKHLLQRQVQDFLCVLAFGLLVYVFASQRSIFARMLSQPWLVYLGDVSFSIYMLQGLVGAPLHFDLRTFSSEWCLYVTILIAASGISYALIEAPSRKFIVGQASSFLHQSRSRY